VRDVEISTGAEGGVEKVAFFVRGCRRSLEGIAPELNLVVQGRRLGELRANIVAALRARFGREQPFSMLVGA
jgi:hypothetical protein